jgi:TolB-like protein
MEFRFGGIRLKVKERQLQGPRGAITIDGRSVDVLRVLLERPNELVLKNDIFAAVWPGMVIGDNTLQVHISSLRRVLGREVIETVHGRGYKYRGPEPEIIDLSPGARKAVGERPIVAVLPFKTVEDDQELKSFCEAITGELVERLSRFRLISVVPYPAAGLPEQDSSSDSDTQTNRADFLLTGEARRSGSRIRFASKLQDPQSRVVVWAEHFDRSPDDLFAVLDELSGSMAGKIHPRIESHLVTRHAAGRSLTSYDHLIKGIWHFRSRTPDGPRQAEQLFRKAREINPANAEAVRWLSMKMTCQWLHERNRSLLMEGLALGRAAAELDPGSATCHAAHGFAQLWSEGAEVAEVSFRKAYAINPNDGYMLADVGLTHIYCGRLNDAEAILERAEQLNPFPNDWHGLYRSIARFVEGRYEEAVPGIQRFSWGAFSLLYLLACHGHLGNRMAINALMPQLRSVDLDLVRASCDEPFLTRATVDRLANGVDKALDMANGA